MRRRICFMICFSAIVGVSLGMQMGMYMWHVPPAFPKPVEKVKDTFVEEHHARPLLKTRVENYVKPSPCAARCLAHLRAYYNHYYGKEIVYERAEGCNVVFREGVDVSRMNVSAYEKFEHVLRNVSETRGGLLGTCDRIHSLKDCQPSLGISPLDLVIPLLDPTDPALKRTLRSFEKNGLLDMVRHVFIITNDASVHPELVRQYHGLRVVSLGDINVPYDLKAVREKGSWTKMFSAPFLNGVAENYIMTPDDTILNRPIKPEYLFDFKNKMHYAHSFGSSRAGNTMSYINIAPLHGPNILNRCAMKFIIQKYKDVRPAIDPIAVTLGEMKSAGLISDLFRYHSSKFRRIAGMDYFSECHTNGGCRKPGFDDLFVNIQGNGISKEYGNDNNIRDTFDSWFKEQFPTPSRYEKRYV